MNANACERMKKTYGQHISVFNAVKNFSKRTVFVFVCEFESESTNHSFCLSDCL